MAWCGCAVTRVIMIDGQKKDALDGILPRFCRTSEKWSPSRAGLVRSEVDLARNTSLFCACGTDLPKRSSIPLRTQVLFLTTTTTVNTRLVSRTDRFRRGEVCARRLPLPSFTRLVIGIIFDSKRGCMYAGFSLRSCGQL